MKKQELPGRTLVVIVGPTAVGKTNFAVEMAKFLNAEIISADSRQFYKELCIGTAKPTMDEMQGVQHHFVDFLSIEDEYNAYDFEKETLQVLDQLFENNHFAILTGGSGLYVKAVCEGIDLMPDIPIESRLSLKNQLEENGLEFMLERLKQIDREYYQIVDKQNPARILRALEIYETTNKPYSTFRKGEKAHRAFKILKIGLEREREELYQRINQRMDIMIGNGLFAEAENLFEMRHMNALKTVGYKEIFDYMEGKYDRDEAIRLLKRNSRRYAKRQMTWFKKDEEIKWFHPDKFEEVLKLIAEGQSE